MNDRQGIQVIARAAAILRRLEQQPEGASLADLAAALGLARSTVHRIVSALSEEGLVASAGARAGYRLGPAILRMAATSNVDVERIARPFLVALSRALGETVDLSVLNGNEALFVEQVQGPSRLVARSAIGDAFPLHCTANGKALLARLPKSRRSQLLAGTLPALTPATITDPALLEAEIGRFGTDQYAVDNQEHTEGICAIGTSFIDPLGRNYAISVPVPATRFFSDKREQIVPALLATREKLVSALSGS